MAELFEVFMVVCFGLSWPISIWKSWTSRSTKGKSVVFTGFIWIGYLCGIIGKFAGGNVTYVTLFYVINLIAVTIDISLYARNRGLERRQEAQESAQESAQI